MAANRYVRIFYKLILLLVAIGVVCGALYLLYTIVSGSWVPDSTADITYAVKSAKGSEWYELQNGRIVTYPELPDVAISGITRGGGKTFILGTSNGLSVIYSYDPVKKVYTKVYSSSKPLNDLSVDENGLYVAFVSPDSTVSTPDVNLLTLASGKVTQEGYGYSPTFLGSTQETSKASNGKPFTSDDGYMNLLYLHGPAVEAQMLYKGTVSSTTVVAFFALPFGLNTQMASDGKTLFGFTDPVSSAEDMWKETIAAPFTASPTAAYQNAASSMFGFTNGSLTRLVLVPASTGKSGPAVTSVKVTIFGTQSTQASAPSVLIPLKAAGTGQPLFVGLISS